MAGKIVELDLKHEYRIVVISDIHGHNLLFDELLEKVNLADEDYLIILGDFISKGVNSYKTLKRIKELSRRANTIILKGNHELNAERKYFSKENNLKIETFLKKGKYENIFQSMLEADGVTISEIKTDDELYDYFKVHHEDDFNFIRKLPIIAQSEEFIFVHGGYDDDWDLDDEKKFLKYDNYNCEGKSNEKMVVVGHWPTCNIRNDRICNEPYINNEKRIISIDGGLGVKQTGELTAFIIEKKSEIINYDFIQHNHFTKDTIVKSHEFLHEFQKEQIIYVNYPHFDISMIKKGDTMSKCYHTNSKSHFTVFNGLVIEDEEGIRLKTNYVNNFLNLVCGDVVKVVKKYEDCILVKYKDEFGWILPEQLLEE